MVQQFNVLRCFSCQTFQVHQVKKANKWSCKVCGEKQSTKKIYGQGSAPDCRKHVQKLNSLQGQLEQMKGEKAVNDVDDDHDDHESECGGSVSEVSSGSGNSRWEKYVETDDGEGTCTTEELWHGVPITTDATLFQDTNKPKHKRKRQNKHETPTFPKYKRQNNSTYDQNPSRTNIRDDSNNEFMFSGRKKDENVDTNKQFKWGKFQGKTSMKQPEYPATCTDIEQGGDFLFTRKQLNRNERVYASSKWKSFQEEDSLVSFADNWIRSTNVSVSGKMNRDKSVAGSQSKQLFTNDILQNGSAPLTGKEMNEKEMTKVSSKWDKFQSLHTPSNDSDENDDGDELVFHQNEVKITGKKNINYIGSKWDKYQNYQTPSDNYDDDDDIDYYENSEQNIGYGSYGNDGGDDEVVARGDHDDSSGGNDDGCDGAIDDSNDGDNLSNLQNFAANVYGDGHSSGSNEHSNKTAVFTAHQVIETNKENAQSKWNEFETCQSSVFKCTAPTNDNLRHHNKNQVDKNLGGNNQSKCAKNYPPSFTQDYSYSKVDSCQTSNALTIQIPKVTSLGQQKLEYPTDFGKNEELKKIKDNKDKSDVCSNNVFQIDEDLEGEWWNV